MTQDERISQLVKEISPLREKLTQHAVYSTVENVDDLKVFMQHHIYAVWDFMSLLKYLQQKLTCISVPWVPIGDPESRYLINEIVTDEECDENEHGVRMSHYELYLTAMKKANADTSQIESFIDLIKSGVTPDQALIKVDAAAPVQKFVNQTFSVINMDKPHVAAAVFTCGREDLIPGMFISFVQNLYDKEPEKYSIFKYYLERHIEVDGDHHSQLAFKMTSLLCGSDDAKWEEATTAVKTALQDRIDFWDGIRDKLLEKKN